MLAEYDIVCLQETWLSKQQEEELTCMRVDCNAVSNSPNDDSLCITAGRKKEGVGILWKKHLDRFVCIGILLSRKTMVLCRRVYQLELKNNKK